MQKECVLRCRQQGKPVIVASHLLQSMMDAPCPTRAEVRTHWAVQAVQALGKLVIVASHLLQSMMDAPCPTRAEVRQSRSKIVEQHIGACL